MNHFQDRVPRLFLGLCLSLALIGLALSGCGDSSEDSGCSSRDDCARDEVCRAGACAAPSSDGACTVTDECPRFESCSGGICVPDGGASNGTSNGTTGDTSNGTTGNTSNGTTDTSNGTTSTSNGTTSTSNGTTSTSNGTTGMTTMDREPPVVVSTVPDSGETSAATDTTIVITFNEAVRDFGLEQKIMLQRADNLEAVPFSAANADGVVTMTPDAPLQPGTPYQVTIDTEVVDTSGNRLADIYRWRFATAIPEEPEYATLASTYAPVIYQEVDPDGGVGRGDYFGAIDLDGDLDVSNNPQTFRNIVFPAKAYYGVLETTTHYFVQYLYYYPSNYNSTTERTGHHDVTAIQVVLLKGDEPKFLMAEASSGGEPYFGFAVAGSGVSDRSQGSLELTFPAEEMWQGTHYLAYHGRYFHGSCHWNWEPGVATTSMAPWCNHNEGQFLDNTSSLVYYPAPEGQPWNAANCNPNDMCAADQQIACVDGTCRDEGGTRAVTYSLGSFFAELWSRRITLSEDVNLFGPTTSYEPHSDSGDRPGRDENRRFPATLATIDGSRSRGQLPFSWDSNGSVAEGQWWVDPAWSFSVRFAFGEELGQEYCFNPYFDIDRRGQEGCE